MLIMFIQWVKNTVALLVSGEGIVLEVNADKTKYMVMS